VFCLSAANENWARNKAEAGGPTLTANVVNLEVAKVLDMPDVVLSLSKLP